MYRRRSAAVAQLGWCSAPKRGEARVRARARACAPVQRRFGHAQIRRVLFLSGRAKDRAARRTCRRPCAAARCRVAAGLWAANRVALRAALPPGRRARRLRVVQVLDRKAPRRQLEAELLFGGLLHARLVRQIGLRRPDVDSFCGAARRAPRQANARARRMSSWRVRVPYQAGQCAACRAGSRSRQCCRCPPRRGRRAGFSRAGACATYFSKLRGWPGSSVLERMRKQRHVGVWIGWAGCSWGEHPPARQRPVARLGRACS